MDVMALSRILGHRDASMTLNVYADALEETKRAGMETLDSMLVGLTPVKEEKPRKRAKHMRIVDDESE